MADYSALKATIDASINTNGQQAITGAILNDVLNEMVDVLGEGYVFLGVATPQTNPTTPEGKAYYLAGAAGTYSNFGNIVVASDEVALLVWNGTAWSKVVSPAASKEEVSQLGQKVTTFNADMTIVVTQGQGANTGSNPAYLTMPMLGGVTYKVIAKGDVLESITLRPRTAGNAEVSTLWENPATSYQTTAVEFSLAVETEYEITPSANVERMGIYYSANRAVGSGNEIVEIRTAIPSLEEQIEEISDEIDGLPERVTTLENKVSFMTGGLKADEVFDKSVGLPKTDGTIDTSPATRDTSDYIPFNDDITIYNAFTGSASAYAQVQFFDSSKNYLTYRRGTGNTTDAELTLLKADYPDAAYIRYGLPTGNSLCHALLSVSVRDYVDKYVSSPNFGASVSLFGASFSAEVSGYYAYVGLNKWRDKLGLQITNYSTPGAGFTPAASSLIQTQVDAACADAVETTDIYIIWASANDYGGQGTIGVNSDYTIDDNYNTAHLNTFCGGLNYCIKKILEKAPTSKIILLTSLRNGHADSGRNPYSTGSGNNLAKYVDAEKECCYRYGVPYFDQFAMFPMNEFTKDSYLQEDGRHPNAVCYERLADMQIPFLANI